MASFRSYPESSRVCEPTERNFKRDKNVFTRFGKRYLLVLALLVSGKNHPAVEEEQMREEEMETDGKDKGWIATRGWYRVKAKLYITFF